MFTSIPLVMLLVFLTNALGEDRATPAEAVKEPELRRELLERRELDQAARRAILKSYEERGLDLSRPVTDPSLIKAMMEIGKELEERDRRNTARLKEIVAQHGWPGMTLVGIHGTKAAWLLVQHADKDLPFQKKCLELMKAMPAGEVELRHVAYLTDRILIKEHKKQVYGTQLGPEPNGGGFKPLPIEDEASVDKRRAAMKMEPLGLYIALTKIATKKVPPDKPKRAGSKD